MKAVVRLVATCFNTTAWLQWLAMSGVSANLFYQITPTTFSSVSGLQALGLCAVGALFLGGSMMPLVFGRLARSHAIDLLPHGRIKLLASALSTTTVVSIPIAVATLAVMKASFPGAFQDMTGTGVLNYLQTADFWRFFAIAMLLCAWTYAVLWSGARMHSAGVAIRTVLLMFSLPALLALRKYWLGDSETSATLLLGLVVVIWGLFAICFLSLPSLKHFAGARLVNDVAALRKLSLNTSYSVGKEMRAMFGLLNTWVHVVSILVVGAMVVLTTRSNGGWFFYLTILGLTCGAMPAYASGKSRTLWLRMPWSREELFGHVERFYWREAASTFAPVLILLLAFGTRLGIPWPLMALGVLHGVITTLASIYFGLLQTRNHPFADGTIGTVMCLFAVGAAAAANGDFLGVLLLTALLGPLTILCRFIAKRRWTQLDWILCKSMRIAG